VTAPHPFAALVRRLDAEASAAPWFGGHLSMNDDVCDCTYVLNEHQMGDVATFAVRKDGDPHGSEYPTKVECIANMAITRTLRNAAPEVAALVEAAGEAVSAAEYVIALCHDDLKRGRDPSPLVASTPSATLAHAYAAMAFVGELRAALDALRVVATQAKEAK